MASLLTELRTRFNTFSKTQKDIANFILKDPDRAVLCSITELARNCSTSETTVMRLLKKMDIDSYQIFRINLAKELTESPKKAVNEELTENDTLDTIKQKVILHNVTSMQDLSHSLKEKDLEQAIELISEADRIFFYGVGASAAISLDAFHKFGNIGLNVFSFPDSHLMNILSSHSNENDLFMAFSHTGESMEVLSAARIAKENKTKILSITSFQNSTLSGLSDLVLVSSTNEKKYHSESMASRLLQMTIIDILYIGLFMKDEEKRYDALTQSRIAVSQNKT